MVEWIAFFVLVLGGFFVLVSAIGILRFPDLYMRMHATTKTTSIGITAILIAVILVFPDFSTILKSLMVIVFIYLTTPLGAHMIAKVGIMMNIKLWNRYEKDEPES